MKYIRRSLLLLILMLAFVCAGCDTGNTVTTKKVVPTPQPTQPVSTQEILANPVVYVALGASDAVGVGSNEPGSEGYVPLVAGHLMQGSHLVNLGISGIHLHDAIDQELPIALSTGPQLVTIWLVANDFVAGVSYDSYMGDLDTLLKQLRAGIQTHIVMANLPDLTLLPTFSRLKADRKAAMQKEIRRWNAHIGEVAQKYDVAVVDLFSKNSQLTAHPEFISGDGFHPSPAGYVQLANFFWGAIDKQG